MDLWLLATLIGYGGMCLHVGMFVWHNPRWSILTEASGDSLFIVHYLLLGLVAPALMLGVAILRMLLSVYVPDGALRYVVFGYLIGIWVSAPWIIQQPAEILALVGSSAAAMAAFGRNHFMVYRLGMNVCCISWLVFAVLVASWPMAIGAAIGLAFNVASLFYFKRKQVSLKPQVC